MLRSLLLAALLCPLALAQAKPPATLAELKANPAGLTAYNGDIREAYGQFPVTSVYVRESELGQVSYLLHGDKVFGYHFRFQKAGEDTLLWQESTNAFLDATFPAETFQRQSGFASSMNNMRYRTEAVLNTKAYAEAMRSYRHAEDERLFKLVTGVDGGAPALEEDPAPGSSRTIADYLKTFPETVSAALENGMVPGFEHYNFILAEFPYDALHRRKAGEAELLIVSRKGTIIGYLAKLPAAQSGELGNGIRKAGIAAAFPEPAFERQEAGESQGFHIYSVKDRAAFAAAREAHLSEEAVKLKALLNP